MTTHPWLSKIGDTVVHPTTSWTLGIQLHRSFGPESCHPPLHPCTGRLMFAITVGHYTLSCHSDRLPDLYRQYVERAGLAEEFGLKGSEGRCCFLAVSRGVEWPFLVVAQRYDPAGGGPEKTARAIPRGGCRRGKE